jgi:transcriptional regulator of arginine metabolism
VLEELVRQGDVHSQAELVERLRARGFDVTQSSVSRDLRDLRVGKVAGRYVLPATFFSSPEGSASSSGPSSRRITDTAGAAGSEDPLASEIARWVVGVHTAGPNLLVVKTVEGAAMQVAANLDQAAWSEVAGTVAGDDTIFVATAGRAAQNRVARRLTSSGTDTLGAPEPPVG